MNKHWNWIQKTFCELQYLLTLQKLLETVSANANFISKLFFLRFHFITVSCLRLMFKLTWYLDLQCRFCPKTKQMSENCKQTNLNKTLYYTTIYLLGLSVCLFVSNKRKNDWTDRDGRKISILPGHTNLHVIFIKIHHFKKKNR